MYDLKVVMTKKHNEYMVCQECAQEFETGQLRYLWRLKFNHGAGKYHTGQFWACTCYECFDSIVTEWIHDLNEMKDNIINQVGGEE